MDKKYNIQTCAHGKFINLSENCKECIQMARGYNLMGNNYYFTEEFIKQEFERERLLLDQNYLNFNSQEHLN